MPIEDIDIVTEDITFLGAWEKANSSSSIIDTAISEEIVSGSEETESNLTSTSNSLVKMLKRIYYGTGLDSFGRGRLILLGVFGLVFLGLVVGEVIYVVRQRRSE